MQNRIDQCFERLRARNEKGFIAYICAGDPRTLVGQIFGKDRGFCQAAGGGNKARLGEHVPNESNSKPEHDRSAHGLTADLPAWPGENPRTLFHGKTEDERPRDCTRDNRASQRQRMEKCVVLSAGLLTADYSQPEPNVPGTR